MFVILWIKENKYYAYAKGKDVLNAHNNHNCLIETRNYSPRVAPELFN